MIKITGDTHGDRNKIGAFINELNRGDTGIVAGDFGFLFKDDSEENSYLDDISQICKEKCCLIAFVPGNHENYDALFDASRFPAVMWNSGKARQIRDNIVCLISGVIYCIEGKTFLSFGGGYSIDKTKRIAAEKITGLKQWWEQELPTEEDYLKAKNNLSLYENKVDFVVTHTAPAGVFERMKIQCRGELTLTDVPQEQRLREMLEDFAYDVSFTDWYFGHFHLDCSFGNFFSTYGAGKTFRCLLHDIVTA